MCQIKHAPDKGLLTDVAAVIAACGGPTAMGAALGERQNTVSNWAARRAFPERVHLRVYLLCQRMSIAISPELVGLELGAAPVERMAV